MARGFGSEQRVLNTEEEFLRRILLELDRMGTLFGGLLPINAVDVVYDDLVSMWGCVDTQCVLDTAKIIIDQHQLDINYLLNGVARQRKVIDLVDNTAVPPTEVDGDRYALDFTAGTVNAAWDGAVAGDIVTFNGTSGLWEAVTPEEGFTVYVDALNQDAIYVNDGTAAWELRPAQANTTYIAADQTAANLLTGLNEGDMVFIQDTGSGEWALQIVEAITTGAYTTSTITTVSTQQIIDSIQSLVNQIQFWQEPVINQIDFTASEPGSPTVGDRYINTTAGNTSGTTQAVSANSILEWNGTDWTEVTPLEGYAVYDETSNNINTFNGVSWSVPVGGAHASTHIKDGTDEFDADKADIDTTFTNITPNTTQGTVTDNEHLGAILAGIDDSLGDRRDNRVFIKQYSDFPAPVAGVITLGDFLYEINGDITIPTNVSIDWNGCRGFVGREPRRDSITKAGDGPLFIDATKKGVFIENLTILGTPTGIGNSLFGTNLGIMSTSVEFDNCNIGNFAETGSLDSYGGVTFKDCVIQGMKQGLVVEDIVGLELIGNTWTQTNSNTFVKMIGSFSRVNIRGGNMTVAGTSTGLDVAGITAITYSAVLTDVGSGVITTGNLSTGSFAGWYTDGSLDSLATNTAVTSDKIKYLDVSSSEYSEMTLSDLSTALGVPPAAPVDSVNSQTGVVVLDADDIDDTSTSHKFVTSGDLTNLSNLSGINSGDEVSATDAIEGIVELATQTEVDTGTDTTRVITPATLANSTLASNVSTNNAKVSNVSTSLSIGTKTGTTLGITSDGGADDVVLPQATITEAGLISATDQVKLNNTSGTNTGDEVSATTAIEGVGEIATQSEVNTGTDTTRWVTPDTLEDKTYGTFTGSIITDNVTLKIALQELETAVGGAGGESLSATLAIGNTSGANDISMDTGQKITFGAITRYIFDSLSEMFYKSDTEHVFTTDESDARVKLRPGPNSGRAAILFRNGNGFGTDPFHVLENATSGVAKNWRMPEIDGTLTVTTQLPSSSTTSTEGIAELATQAEVNAGTDTTRIVTPDTLEDKTMGTYTGTTISDNVVLKTVLQELETAVESAASSGLATKAGIVASGSFTGSPRKAAVVFSTAFADNSYAVTVTGEDSRTWTIESKTAAGFTINANSGSALSGNTFWNATKVGETS